MTSLTFSDEKLYRISAADYGGPLRRVCGTVLYSLAKGMVLAIAMALVFAGATVEQMGRNGIELFLAISLVCALGVGIVDRRVFVCEVEIFPDRVVRHSGDKTLGIGLTDLRTIKEGGAWTLFGFVNGLSISNKKNKIFIPAGCPDYVEIKSKLGAWRTTFD